jgi:hypothetical protein
LAGWAHCQKNDDYHLTLIDPHARAIPRVEQSLYIFVDANSLRRKNVSGSWLRLQQDLGSTAEQIHANDGSLSVLEPYEHTTDVGYAISKGMERIRVPNWFTSSVQAGRIKFFQKDIRDIRGISDQSLIFCLNVLLHYQQPEQEEMLTIMSSMLGKGKILVINEGKRDQQSSLVTDFRKQLFRKNGGWLEEEDLQAQFQLRIADTMDNGRIFLLEKV